MERYTQKELKELSKFGFAVDLTYATSENGITEQYTQVGYSAGAYGCNGLLLKGTSGQLYVVVGRTKAMWIFS